jgi:hypothetical protein
LETPATTAPGAAASTPEPGLSGYRLAGWIGVGVTAALLTTAAMFALAAQSREDDIARRQRFVDPMTGQPLDYNAGGNRADYLNLVDEGHSYRDYSIGFFVASGAIAAGSITMFLLDHYQNGSNVAQGGVRVGAAGVPGGAQLSLGWSFR